MGAMVLVLYICAGLLIIVDDVWTLDIMAKQLNGF